MELKEAIKKLDNLHDRYNVDIQALAVVVKSLLAKKCEPKVEQPKKAKKSGRSKG